MFLMESLVKMITGPSTKPPNVGDFFFACEVVDNLEPATFKIDTSSVCSNCTKIAAQFVLQVFKFGFDLIFLRTTS